MSRPAYLVDGMTWRDLLGCCADIRTALKPSRAGQPRRKKPRRVKT
jgi:hypothetical protein